MAANNSLVLTGVNFDEIKSNLRNFLSNQSDLEDYDYDASTMQILLNLLSYNTYMNAYYTNMIGNEMFLDSAQIRNNVVSRAKMLGYTPRSARGATATVQVVVTPTGSPDTITIAENTKFRATIDGENFIFVNPDAKVINADSTGTWSTNIDITEGQVLTHRFTVNSQNPVPYVIPNDNVDTTSLIVKVQNSSGDLTTRSYDLATDLTEVTKDSYVYFLDENIDGKYEIHFGDNILGKQLNDGNIVIVTYRVCNGTDAQSAQVFTAPDGIGGYSSVTVNTVSAAQGGSDREAIQSIKYNAPKNYEAQNRAVTKKDYEVLVRRQFGDIQAISVWGGEDNSPPVYGKVYLSVKPRIGNLLSVDRKADIVDYLIDHNVLAVEPEVVDPTFLYVVPEVIVHYNPKLTSKSPGTFADDIANIIRDYEDNYLGLFNQQFKNSRLIQQINDYNEAVDIVSIEMKMRKKILPNTSAATTYRIPFNNQVHQYENVIKAYNVTSTQFTFAGRNTCYFDDDGAGSIRIYYLAGSAQRNYILNNAGTIDYNSGLIVLNNLHITAYEGDALEITVDPEEDYITPVRNQILLIDDARVDLYDIDIGGITASVTNILTQGRTNQIRESGVLTTVY